MNRLLKVYVAVPLAMLAVSAVAQAQNRGRGPASRPSFQIPRIPINPNLPTLWLIGDSTVRQGTNDNGDIGQWGWGNPIRHYFDETKINVQNRAVGGTTSRSFQAMHWPWILEEIKPGDFLVAQFGHNDGGGGTPRNNSDEVVERPVPRRGGRGRGAATQPADPNVPVQMERVHSFGWYMRKYVTDAREHGIKHIVLASPIPRNRWEEGKILPDQFGLITKDAAAQVGCDFIDLNALIITKYLPLGAEKVNELYFPDPNPNGNWEVVHTNWAGAILNAECVIEGLRQINSPLVQYLKPNPPRDLKHPSNRAR